MVTHHPQIPTNVINPIPTPSSLLILPNDPYSQSYPFSTPIFNMKCQCGVDVGGQSMVALLMRLTPHLSNSHWQPILKHHRYFVVVVLLSRGNGSVVWCVGSVVVGVMGCVVVGVWCVCCVL